MPFAGLRVFLFLFFVSGWISPPAFALNTSPHALRLEDSSRGNLLLGAEEATIATGEIFQTVVLLWGNLAVHGQVDRVLVLSGKVTFHPGAKLGDSLVVMGGGFESLPGADIPESKVSLRAPGPLWKVLRAAGHAWRENIGWLAMLTAAFFTCVGLWMAGAALFTFFPALRRAAADPLGAEWGRNLFIGLLGSVLTPVVMVLLVISVVGILALPIYLALLAFAALVSYFGAALWAGHRLLPPAPGRAINYGGFFLGLAAFQLFWLVGGWAILAVMLLWTLAWGALLRGLRAPKR